MMRFLLKFILFFSFLSIASPTYAVSVIRDSEIEKAIFDVSAPLFSAAGLDPSAMKVIIVNDPEMNAFVTGGLAIYLHTGLLLECTEPEILAGVVAHETGHITGGHVLRTRDSLKSINLQMVAGYMLGMAASVLGSPEAGQAILLGSQHIAERSFLKYSRDHEKAADQSALSLLDKVGYSAQGYITLFEILDENRRLIGVKPNPYTSTHPLTQDRITAVRYHIDTSNKKSKPYAYIEQYELAHVKLKAFLNPPEKTLQEYPVENTSMKARYARAVAYYRSPNLEASLKEIQSLLKAQPRNPYFHELQGQILFENGRITPSIVAYSKAHTLLPDDPLIRIQLATAQLASNQASFITNAINNLQVALKKETTNRFAWKQLAVAYGKDGDLGRSYAALAEAAFLTKNKGEVKKFAKLAKEQLSKDSPSYVRVQDLLIALENQED